YLYLCSSRIFYLFIFDFVFFFFFSSRRRHTRWPRDWSSDVCSSDLTAGRVDRDFGRGFYTTTLEKQARHWAWLRFYDPKFARTRSEERRVGKECRSRWSPDQ